MKKQLLLFALWMFGIIGASAWPTITSVSSTPVTDLSTLSADKLYVMQIIKNGSTDRSSENKFFKVAATKERPAIATMNTEDSDNSAFLFRFTPLEAAGRYRISVNSFYIASFNTAGGFYASENTDGDLSFDYALEAADDNTFKLHGYKNNAAGSFIVANNDEIQVVQNANAASAATFRIYEVTVGQLYPFELSTLNADGTFSDNTKWYNLAVTIPNSTNVKNVYATESAVMADTNGKKLSKPQLVCFVADEPPMSVKVYSLLAGAGKPLSTADASNSTAASFSETGSVSRWSVRPNTNSPEGTTSGFALTTNYNTAALNLFGGGDQIKIYVNSAAPTGKGSCFTPYSITESLSAALAYGDRSEYLQGYRLSDELRAAQDGYNETNSVENLATLVDVWNDAEKGGNNALKMPVSGKLYQLIFNRGEHIISLKPTDADADGNFTVSGDAGAVAGALNDQGLNSLWMFDAVEGSANTYHIHAANTPGYYLGTPTGTTGTTATFHISNASDTYAAYTVEGGSALLKGLRTNANTGDTKTYLNTSYGSGEKPEYASICRWEPGVEKAGNQIKIKEVDSFTLTIGEAGWSTLHLNFAVQLPEGLNAYALAGTQGNNQPVTLSDVGRIIPKDTPVLVSKNGSSETSFTLKLVANAEAYSGTNLLSGTLLRRTGMETSGSYYVLAYKDPDGDGTKSAVLCKSFSVAVPANKAFLPVAALSGSGSAPEMFTLFPGEELTGISQAVETATEASKHFYDLNGRRVLFPGRGIYVTGEGKKVFIP
ncbi:MAG: hypothetical protein ACI3YC_00245 [Alloprevotella sp.]